MGFVPPLEHIEAYPHISESLYNAQKICAINEYTDDIPGILCDLMDIRVDVPVREHDPMLQFCTAAVVDEMVVGTKIEFGEYPPLLESIYEDRDTPDAFQIESFIPIGDQYQGGSMQASPPDAAGVRGTLLNHHWEILLGCNPRILEVPFRLMWRVEGQEDMCRASHFNLKFTALRDYPPFSGVYAVNYSKDRLVGAVHSVPTRESILLLAVAAVLVLSFFILLKSFIIVCWRVIHPKRGLLAIIHTYVEKPSTFRTKLRYLSPLLSRGILSTSMVVAETFLVFCFLASMVYTTYILCRSTDTLLRCHPGGHSLRPTLDEGADRIHEITTTPISVFRFLISSKMDVLSKLSLLAVNLLSFGVLHSVFLAPFGIIFVLMMFDAPTWLKRVGMAFVVQGCKPILITTTLLLTIILSLSVFCANKFPYLWAFSSLKRSFLTLLAYTLEIHEPEVEEMMNTDGDILKFVAFIKLFKIIITLFMIPLVISITFNTLGEAAEDSGIEFRFISKLIERANIQTTYNGLDSDVKNIQASKMKKFDGYRFSNTISPQ
eukprot:GHVH01010992.1.p1 GENE.GHVH01010992.1~~GHVH01010992.1.p1  ORF type:complete len:548 (+),score=70.49 GHVH01010992.1:514-2157(+)